ncbi:hypothetical protein [Vreelandella stevensii]|uniref:hypothetical protein n=1 Tax=Vreelandella stevensii TaxID=502821 RepID=UPI0012EA6EE0|nr:hypothetical protein [Halomonas stevensii]
MSPTSYQTAPPRINVWRILRIFIAKSTPSIKRFYAGGHDHRAATWPEYSYAFSRHNKKHAVSVPLMSSSGSLSVKKA